MILMSDERQVMEGKKNEKAVDLYTWYVVVFGCWGIFSNDEIDKEKVILIIGQFRYIN